MDPLFADDFVTIYHGDAWALAQTLEPKSVHTIVTSPPYWGLRDYGEPGQFGPEQTPEEYVEKLVSLFALLRPALRDDGTVWLNLGDSYAGSWANDHPTLKAKDLVGIPWRVAFALQADGWYLRSDIYLGNKPNPMPESVTDRPTKAHEYVFLLSKQARYHYDAEAIKELSVTLDDRKPYAPGSVRSSWLTDMTAMVEVNARQKGQERFATNAPCGLSPPSRSRKPISPRSHQTSSARASSRDAQKAAQCWTPSWAAGLPGTSRARSDARRSDSS